jgi:photosystem II stability/assembly factor-like uncharacterized protein
MVLLAGMLMGQSIPRSYAAVSCDQAQFVSDITVPDGASFIPGASFTKTWRFTNAGTCTWTTAYKVVFAGEDAMGSTTSVNLPVNVAPGKTVDVSINLTAPSTAGHYKSLWKFSNASGAQFGIGDSGTDPFWVDINVVSTSAVIYDFVANAIYAKWKSGAGPLPYPGTSGDYRGYAYQVNQPHLEDDSFDTQPGLLTVPQSKFNGYIQATYPEFQVQQGDKLQTLVNCEFGATGCYVTFRIDYLLPNGVQKTLWSWKEAYDKRFYRADIDLSSLAGQKVRFAFLLLATGSATNDRAIWGSPRIVRAGTTQPPAPPSTLTPLPALTPTQTPLVPPPPTVQSYGCDRASFVTDVTIPDGTTFTPGAGFSKTWRLKNSGSCTWTKDYKLTFYSGEQMSAPTAINIPWNVYNNQTIDLTVNMAAPNSPGEYRGYWILTNASGTFFGIGPEANKAFWVDINVSGDAPQEVYNLWTNACSAQWKSGAGPLPCPGTEGDRKGFIIADGFSHLEDGTMGPLPSLLMSPENKFNGYIQGYYPALTIQPGDHFRSTVGCEYGYSCYVTFRLDYMTPNGGIFNFWQWKESNDKKNATVDVDLTPLAGKSVRLILTILATGTASGDRVRWGGPVVVRTSGGTTPPTSLPPTPIPPTVPVPTLSPPIYAPNIRSLHMLDPQNGWALSDQYVLRTLDGGTTWYNVLFESLPVGGYFASPSKAWVISNYADLSAGSLYRTTNGGLSWSRYDVPFNGGYIQFVDDNTGYVLQITGAAMNKQSVILYKTTDGGATWTKNYNNDPTVPGSSNTLPLSGHKNGMTFTNATTGWIGGDSPLSGSVYLYKTTDSGVTWTKQSVPIPAGYEDAAVVSTAPKFFGTNDGILPVWMSAGIDMRDLFLYVTHNGGNTWTPSPAFARNADFIDIISMSNTIGWDRANVFHGTANSGNSWTTVTPNVTFEDEFRQLDFVSPTIGWVRTQLADGHTGLYKTTDGGSTWILLYGHTNPNPTPTQGPDPATFTQSVVDTLNAKNFNALPASMDQFFVFAYWQSQGTVYPSDEAIEQLRLNHIGPTPLTSDPNKDLIALLGGQNPYAIVGLDPAKSYALFVSGWGLDGKGEAILYTTQRADGSLYWHSVLVAPTKFNLVVTPTPTPAMLIGPYAVVNVAPNDVLNIRSGPGVSYSVIGSYPPGATDVMRTGASTSADGAVWVEVRKNDGLTGWVNSYYLTEYVTHDAFCADNRILPLIEQVKQSMNQSNGNLLSPIVSPAHGVNMHLWAYGPAVNFTQAEAVNIYTDSTIYDWGGGPSGIPDTGTFNTVVKPKYLEVFNAPNQERYCDDLAKVYPLSQPWPYPNVRFYNLYKPGTPGIELDFRTLLIGIEYINGQPYLHSMVTIPWEP